MLQTWLLLRTVFTAEKFTINITLKKCRLLLSIKNYSLISIYQNRCNIPVCICSSLCNIKFYNGYVQEIKKL